MNIAHLLTRAAGAAADRVAVALGDRPVWTYRDLAARTAALAGGLRRRHGLAPGDRVALVMTNVPDYVATVFACWHAGVTAVPINAKLHPREFAYILGHSGSRLVLVSADRATAVGAALDLMPNDAGRAKPAVVEIGSPDHERLLAQDPLPLHAAAPGDTAWLFYTSGTTGQPKGAMLTHRNLLAMTTSYFVDVDPVRPGDAILHAAPMTHGSGCYMLPHVAGLGVQVIPESGGFDPAEMFGLIRAHPGSSFFAAPTIVHRLTMAPEAGSADVRNLKTLVYGGGPMYLEDCKRALALFGPRLVQIYGQGESPMTITALPRHLHTDTGHPRHEERLASVGCAQTVVEVMVADADDTPLPPGTIGEVLVRGETVMAGYWENPKATADTLRNGWLHTGDLGAMDEDGFLTLKDRSKDLVISGGVNIYPREIEEILLKHEAVAEVAVVGRPHPDWGEELVAFVVPRPGHSVDPAALDALCSDHIARFKRPKRYQIVEALPKNHYGKVLKMDLRGRPV